MMDTDNGILAHNQSAHCPILKWTKLVLGLEWAVCVEYTLSNGWHYRQNRDDGLHASSLREQVSAKPWYRMSCTRTNTVSGIHDWRLARPLDRLKHDFMIVDLKDCSSLQLAARVAGYGCSQTSINEMQEPHRKTTYFKVRLVDEGNHTIQSWALWWSSSKWTGHTVYSWSSPKALKSSCSHIQWMVSKKKRETNSLERKQTRCVMLFNGDTGKPSMFEDAMQYLSFADEKW